jgi:DNA polymerase-3 subunit beta
MARFTMPDTTFITRLTEGNYPNFHQVMPKDDGDGVPVDRVLLLSAVKRVRLVSETYIFEFGHRALNVRTGKGKDDTCGEGLESLLIGKTPERRIMFNVDYVLDALAATDKDQVLLHVTDGVSPILITAVDTTWQCVIMPMREAVVEPTRSEAPVAPSAPAAAAPQPRAKPKQAAAANKAAA